MLNTKIKLMAKQYQAGNLDKVDLLDVLQEVVSKGILKEVDVLNEQLHMVLSDDSKVEVSLSEIISNDFTTVLGNLTGKVEITKDSLPNNEIPIHLLYSGLEMNTNNALGNFINNFNHRVHLLTEVFNVSPSIIKLALFIQLKKQCTNEEVLYKINSMEVNDLVKLIEDMAFIKLVKSDKVDLDIILHNDYTYAISIDKYDTPYTPKLEYKIDIFSHKERVLFIPFDEFILNDGVIFIKVQGSGEFIDIGNKCLNLINLDKLSSNDYQQIESNYELILQDINNVLDSSFSEDDKNVKTLLNTLIKSVSKLDKSSVEYIKLNFIEVDFNKNEVFVCNSFYRDNLIEGEVCDYHTYLNECYNIFASEVDNKVVYIVEYFFNDSTITFLYTELDKFSNHLYFMNTLLTKLNGTQAYYKLMTGLVDNDVLTPYMTDYMVFSDVPFLENELKLNENTSILYNDSNLNTLFSIHIKHEEDSLKAFHNVTSTKLSEAIDLLKYI